MEDFDALMIRVNNLYYGRGRIVMSPDCSRVTSREKDGSSSDDNSCDSASRAGPMESTSLSNKQSQSQVILVDSIVNIGDSTMTCRGQSSCQGVEKNTADSVTCGSTERFYGALKDSKASQIANGTRLERFKKPMFDENGNIQNPSTAVEGCFKKERGWNKDFLAQGFEAGVKLKFNGSLAENPWVSGEVVYKEKELLGDERQSVYKDAALTFRDKLNTWKIARDFWTEGEKLERYDKDDSLGNTDREPTGSRGNAGTNTKAKNQTESGQTLEKDVTRDECIEGCATKRQESLYGLEVDGDIGARPNEGQLTNARPVSNRSSLARSKTIEMSKSHGNLSTLVEEGDLRTLSKGFANPFDSRLERKSWTTSAGNLDYIAHYTYHPSGALLSSLAPAKFVHNLIGKFESIQNDALLNDSPSFGYSPKPKTWKSAEFLTGKLSWGLKPVAKEVSVDEADKGFDRHGKRSLDVTSMPGRYHVAEEFDASMKSGAKRICRGGLEPKLSSTPNLWFKGKGEDGGQYQNSQEASSIAERASNQRSLLRCKSQDDPPVSGSDIRQRSHSSGSFAASTSNKWVSSMRQNDHVASWPVQSALSADILLLEYDEGSTFSLDFDHNDRANEDSLERRCISMCDLSSSHVGSRGYSFYKERFERALSQSKVNVPAFDSSWLYWRSLEELRSRFETNRANNAFGVVGGKRNGRVQQAIIEGMAKYAEQKFGRKRAAPKGGKTRSTMDDYEIYLRSLKTKVKTSQDRLNVVLKQKREIEEKVKKAESEVEKQEKTFREAEEEKKNAEREGRDPKLPSGFVVPQVGKKSVAGAGFANLVMKASAQLWEDKFMAMRAKKGGSEDQPEWLAKSKRSDKILVNVGKKGHHKKEEEQKPAWSTNLKKAEPRRKVEAKHDDTAKQPAFAAVSLRKTAKKEDDEDLGTKKVDWKEMEKKSSSAGGSRRRRGGDDSD